MHIALMTSAMVLWAVAALAQAESRPATVDRPAAETTAEPEAETALLPSAKIDSPTDPPPPR